MKSPAFLLRGLVLSFGLHAFLSAASIDPDASYSGMASTYDNGGNMGACSIPIAETATFYGAMNGVQHDEAEWCGAWVEVTGPLGTAFVQIVEVCNECPRGNLDLGPAAFFEITGDTEGLYPITWRWVSAPGDIGPIHFYSQGSNPYYLKLQVNNTVNPPATMEVFHNGTFESMARTEDYHFVHSDGTALEEPFTIRVTDIFGHEVTTSGLTISATSTGQVGSGNFPPRLDADVALETSDGTPIMDSGSFDFGVAVAPTPETRTFTFQNLATTSLTGISATVDGSHAASFSISTPPTNTLQAEASSPLGLTFTPSEPGLHTAQLHILSNSSVEELASYDVTLTALVLSPSVDTDGDGLNDAAEGKMAALGFNWQSAQPDLVATLTTHAQLAGLYTEDQMRSLQVGVPVLERDPSTDTFTLRLRLRESSQLATFTPLPFISSGVSVSGDGALEYQFSPEGDAAFYRIETGESP
ncbi:expansin (peptidoglycan-binding protein) [Haloferula luteola]|uniref:Expansin (Peptidoglycan-binding protein) n=1 Tax=Haloferula luteola TaxID=595692 RepID=A0A840UWW8_9BACT|nr:expansin EXLX1 family cellulose-binding protein [Haloferula luteola]MBB5350272.1 expansin (peptidoglycan-binding protein) [Haloferula luteola]